MEHLKGSNWIMNINQNNKAGLRDGYWHEYIFTTPIGEHHQSGTYNNGTMIGLWTESLWTKTNHVIKNNRIYLVEGTAEGEAMCYNY